MRHAFLPLAAVVLALAGCGQVTRYASAGERMAQEVGDQLRLDTQATADVACSRDEVTKDFSCRTYRPRTPTVAVQAVYRVHRCRKGGWRAERLNGAKVFPVFVRFEKPKEKPSPDCRQ